MAQIEASESTDQVQERHEGCIARSWVAGACTQGECNPAQHTLKAGRRPHPPKTLPASSTHPMPHHARPLPPKAPSQPNPTERWTAGDPPKDHPTPHRPEPAGQLMHQHPMI